MALIPCPECQHQVSDKAIQCPSCGFGVAAHFAQPSSNAGISESVELEHVPTVSISSPEEIRFRAEALQIVTHCDRALQSPRMAVSSIIAEAEGGLGTLRANFRSFLRLETYVNVEPYLMGLIDSVRLVQAADESTSELPTEGFAGLVNKGNRMVMMEKAMRLPKAYLHDLRIILGAAYGTANEVEKIHQKIEAEAKPTPVGQQGCVVLLAGMLAFSCCIALCIALL